MSGDQELDRFSERVPPQNLEAEQSVLGACLLDADVLAPVLRLLEPIDFYADKHKDIYGAVQTVYRRRDPVDMITVQDELRRTGKLDDVGGIMYLTTLINMVPTTANTEAYARIVADKSSLRQIQRAARLITDRCYKADSLESFRAEAADLLHGALTGRASSRERHLGPTLLAYAEDVINTQAEGGKQKSMVSTPFMVQDRVMPMARGEVTVAVAQSGVGKTTYEKALQLGTARISGQRVKGYSLEMSQSQLLQKYWGLIAEINTMNIRLGQLTEAEVLRSIERISQIMDLQIYFEARPRMKWADIKLDAMAFAHRHGSVDLITIDYLQILGDEVPKNGRRDSQLGLIVEEAKEIAVDLNCHVCFLAQQKIDKNKPVGENEDVAESRDIIRASDNALFLTRPTEFNPDAEVPMPCRVRSTTPGRKWDWINRKLRCDASHPKDEGRLMFENVMLGFQGKQRMGQKRVIPYEFIPETGVVRDLPPPWPWDDPEERGRGRE